VEEEATPLSREDAGREAEDEAVEEGGAEESGAEVGPAPAPVTQLMRPEAAAPPR
jgi:hypothetical protein